MRFAGLCSRCLKRTAMLRRLENRIELWEKTSSHPESEKWEHKINSLREEERVDPTFEFGPSQFESLREQQEPKLMTITFKNGLTSTTSNVFDDPR